MFVIARDWPCGFSHIRAFVSMGVSESEGLEFVYLKVAQPVRVFVCGKECGFVCQRSWCCWAKRVRSRVCAAALAGPWVHLSPPQVGVGMALTQGGQSERTLQSQRLLANTPGCESLQLDKALREGSQAPSGGGGEGTLFTWKELEFPRAPGVLSLAVEASPASIWEPCVSNCLLNQLSLLAAKASGMDPSCLDLEVPRE